MLDVAKALAELQAKSLAQIEQETAYTWASRALAAMQLFQSTGDMKWLLTWRSLADEAVREPRHSCPGAVPPAS